MAFTFYSDDSNSAPFKLFIIDAVNATIVQAYHDSGIGSPFEIFPGSMVFEQRDIFIYLTMKYDNKWAFLKIPLFDQTNGINVE